MRRALPGPAAPAFVLLALSALLAGTPAAAAEENAWTFRLVQGDATPSVVRVRNRCLEPHRFRVSVSAAWATLDRPADRLRVEARSTVEVGVRFDAAGLAPGVYRGELVVECLDCRQEEKPAGTIRDRALLATCDSEPQRFPVEMTVVAAAAPPPARPASEVRNIEKALRDRLGDALARLAGKRGLAVLPESLAVLSLPGGGLVATLAVAELEKLTAAQLAAGAETMFVHWNGAEYTLALRLDPPPGAAMLLDAGGAVARELPVAAERLADGRTVYAVRLAPELALPVWCSAASAAPPAGELWRGWPLRCFSPAASRAGRGG